MGLCLSSGADTLLMFCASLEVFWGVHAAACQIVPSTCLQGQPLALWTNHLWIRAVREHLQGRVNSGLILRFKQCVVFIITGQCQTGRQLQSLEAFMVALFKCDSMFVKNLGVLTGSNVLGVLGVLVPVLARAGSTRCTWGYCPGVTFLPS